MRRAARIFTVLLALLCLALLALPFTEPGSRFLLAQIDRLGPVEVDYERGALLGDLRLASVRLNLPTVAIDVAGISTRLDGGCLWRSKICFRRLSVERVSVWVADKESDLAGDLQASGEAGSTEALFSFPFPISAELLDIAQIDVSWPGGSWSNAALRAAVLLTQSRIEVSSARVAAARLQIEPGEVEPATDEPVVLPEVALPLQLIVRDLVLEQPGWSIAGVSHSHKSLSLSGRWQRHQLTIRKARIDSADWGSLTVNGQLRMTGDWPLTATSNLAIGEPPIWSGLHGRELGLELAGSLAELDVSASLPGSQALAATATINPLLPRLPFWLDAQASWSGDLDPSSLPGLADAVTGINLSSPMTVSGSGNLDVQRFEAQMAGSGMGYAQARIAVSGSSQPGVLVIDRANLFDDAGDGEVNLQGQLDYAETYDFNLQARSAGIALPALNEVLAGRVQGSLIISGSLAESGWTLGLDDIDLKGEVNGLPAFVRGSYALSSDKLLTAGELDGEVNGAVVQLRTIASGAESGRLLLTLDDLSRWQAGSRGGVTLKADLSGVRDRLRLAGSVDNFAWDGWESPRVDLELEASLVGASPFTAGLMARELSLSDMTISRLQLAIQGDRNKQQAQLELEGDVAGTLKLGGQRTGEDDWHGSLQPTSIASPFGRWQLAAAVPLSWRAAQGALVIDKHCWRNDETRICARDSLAVGQTGKIDLALDGDMGFIAGFFPQGMEVSGTMAASLISAWSPDTETELLLEAKTSDARLTRHYSDEDSATVSWDTVTAQVRRQAGKLQLQANMQREDGGYMAAEFELPSLRSDPLSGQLEFANLRLVTLRPLLPSLARLEGGVTGGVQLAGTLDRPSARGRLQLTQGAIAVHGNPTALTDLAVDVQLAGDRADISGRGLAGGGELSLVGELLLREQPELRLALKGSGHRLLLPPGSEAEVSHELKLVLAKGLAQIEGDVTVHSGLLEPDQLPEGSVDLSGDVVEVDYAGKVLQEQRPFDTRIDVRVRIRDQFRVRGREIDAVVGGDLRLVQELGRPLQLFGSLNVIGGEVRAYGQRLRIKQGTVAFVGEPGNPKLNLRAERNITLEQVRVGVLVLGTAEEPVLEVYSDPAMSQTEALSYLVRGRGLDAGASADGTAVALSLGTGVVNQSGVMSGINSIPGLSNVEFGAEGSADDTAATLGGFIGDRIYLSYGVGLYEPINVLTARFYLQTRLWLEVVSRLENSIDLYYSFDID